MDETRRDDAPSEPEQSWEAVRRIREPLAWALLVLAVIGTLLGVASLLGLRGTVPVALPVGGSGPPAGVPFAVRAFTAAGAFVDLGAVVLAVGAVILVAFAGGLTDRARDVVGTATVILTLDLGLGILCWIGVLGDHQLNNVWFIDYARDLGVVAAGLIFVVAVLRSAALRPLPAQFEDFADDADDDDVDDDDDDAFLPGDRDFGEEEEVNL